MLSLHALLSQMVEKGASALHLTAGAPPTLRVDGRIAPTQLERLTPEACQELVYSILNGSQKARFETAGEIDVSFGVKGLARLRMTVFRQRGSVAAALRLVPARHPTLSELGLPGGLERLIARTERGLVLLAGHSGAGTSSTLSSLVDWINRQRSSHVLTVDRAIERVHFHQRAIVNQVETGYEPAALADALRRAHRQDPDVVAIGELDDPETVPLALGLAESGRLVLAALHAPDAVSAVARLLDAFSPHRQDRARSQLALALQGVMVQTLVPHASGRGRIAACELLLVGDAARTALHQGRLERLREALDTGGEGQSMNESLAALVVQGQVRLDAALHASPQPADLERRLERAALPRELAPAPPVIDMGFNPLQGLDANALDGLLAAIEPGAQPT